MLSQKLTGHKEHHYIMVNASVHQEDVTIARIYIPDIGTPK